MLWAALGQHSFTSTDIGQEFFLTVAACWAVLVPAKCWSNRRGDAWVRRIVMMVLGMAIGFSALWLDGYAPFKFPDTELAMAGTAIHTASSYPHVSDLPKLAQYLSYFTLAFFALRWWKLADRRRTHRFSFAPILAAGFWGLVLLMVWQEPWRGTLVLTTAAAIVQLVSPWEQPPPPLARRMRLRYA